MRRSPPPYTPTLLVSLLLTAIGAAQTTTRPAPVTSVAGGAAQPPQGPVWRSPGLDADLLRIEAGARSAPRTAQGDTLLHVLEGGGTVAIDGGSHAVEAGSLVRIGAGARWSLDAETALRCLSVRSNAVAHSGGMAAGPRPTEQTPYPETSPRGSARIFYWYGPGSAGQVDLDYGRPRWQPKFEQFVGGKGAARWRLGQNFWTRLDTNIGLRFGAVELAPGTHYLVLARAADGELALVALDPAAVRAERLDAWHAPKTQGGQRIPLDHSRTEDRAEFLLCALAVDRERRDRARLDIFFGPHHLQTDFDMLAQR